MESSNQYKVYSMLTPKPKPLLTRSRELVRHGELIYFSPNTMSKKPRYFFLFNDCLLVTKRRKAKKFTLRVFIHLRKNCTVVEGKGSSTEFRLLVPHFSKKARGPTVRPVIMFGHNKTVKNVWVKDLRKCIDALKGGKRGKKIVVHHHHHHHHGGASREADDSAMYMGGSESEDEEDYILSQSDINVASNSDAKEALANSMGADAFSREKKQSSSEEEEEEDHRAGGGEPLNPFATETGEIFDPFNLSGASSTPVPTSASGVPLGVQLAPSSADAPRPYAETGGVAPYPGAPAFPSSSSAAAYPPGALGAAPYGTTVDPVFATAGPLGTGVGPMGVDPLSAGMGQLNLRGAALDTASQLSGMVASSEAALKQKEEELKRQADEAAAALRLQEERVRALEAAQNASLIAAKDLEAREAALREREQKLLALERRTKEAEAERAKQVESGAGMDSLASKELADAASVIEGLVAMLAAKPRKANRLEGDTSPLDLDDLHDAVVDSAQAIAKASAVLLGAAARAQQERVELGMNPATSHLYNPDPVWSNGLISAARYVVGTTQMLVNTANECAEGSAQEEKLVASANAVSVATTQLVTAQTAKSTNAATTKSVQEASNGVRNATSLLVDAISKFRSDLATDALIEDANSRFTLTEAQIAEIEANEKILRLEKETELARKKLQEIHKSKYAK